MSHPLRLGIAGLGTVGIGVVRILRKHAEMLEARTGPMSWLPPVSDQ
jgi:homoserine dehydrogenase